MKRKCSMCETRFIIPDSAWGNARNRIYCSKRCSHISYKQKHPAKFDPTYYQNWLSRFSKEEIRLMRKKAKERHKAKVLRKNPGLIVLSNVLYKRRSRSGPHFTVEEWELIVTKLKGLCGYCGKKRKLTVDHKMPLSKGGSNTIDNIMPACISCNTSKRNKTAEEFVAYKVGSGLFVPAGTRTT